MTSSTFLRKGTSYLAFAAMAALAIFAVKGIADEKKWEVHDRTRPHPVVITPGTASTQDQAGQPPSDAIVLFNGKDISGWTDLKGQPATWIVENGYMQCAKGTIQTKEAFGSCQLHVEWASPNPPKGKDQDRGNSGVFLMSKYEMQVLDSYESETYADGQAAAVYGQTPPLVNACRKPGEWQTYDIVFHRPFFNDDGSVKRPAHVTIIQNGVLVQDNTEITGATAHKVVAKYTKHADKMPIQLQDHNHPVRFRNIWIRPIAD